MYRITLSLLVFAGLFLFSGCDKNSTEPSDIKNYFPMDVNNTWTFVNPNTDTETMHRIWATQSHNNKRYYSYGPDQQSADLIRKDDLGRIWKYKNGQETLWFDVTKKDDATYPYSPPGSSNRDYTVTVSTNVTAELDSLKYENCIQFLFDIPESVDDEIVYTLAPDVGIVRITGAWISLFLKSYSLNN